MTEFSVGIADVTNYPQRVKSRKAPAMGVDIFSPHRDKHCLTSLTMKYSKKYILHQDLFYTHIQS